MKTHAKTKLTVAEEAQLLVELKEMEDDAHYNTPSRYSSNTTLYPDNLITFSALHIANVQKYPDVDLHQYILNLKLMTRIC